jgi:hypothetical protein
MRMVNAPPLAAQGHDPTPKRLSASDPPIDARGPLRLFFHFAAYRPPARTRCGIPIVSGCFPSRAIAPSGGNGGPALPGSVRTTRSRPVSRAKRCIAFHRRKPHGGAPPGSPPGDSLTLRSQSPPGRTLTRLHAVRRPRSGHQADPPPPSGCDFSPPPSGAGWYLANGVSSCRLFSFPEYGCGSGVSRPVDINNGRGDSGAEAVGSPGSVLSAGRRVSACGGRGAS